ncbi:DUF4082 domain-containing protein [Pontibacter roseus]|uniref:DUF4082 domain-containing protein n=1 Tax=Pontibacter roseus TaxID=336989 RepID=UPI00036B6831|nr:DUF4082 domain-containing protein [Pontibacter roseus]
MKKKSNPGSSDLAQKPNQDEVIPAAGIKKFSGSCFSSQRIPVKSFWLLLLLWATSLMPVAAQNPIVVENAKAGNPSSEWQISGAGDLSIQGFATDMSYNVGTTARFKIKTSARAYTIRVYRIGYYGGNGARLQGTGTVTATLPQSQPNCLTNSTTGLVDCGNWAESASWAIPATAVSGIYIAKLTRTDTGGSSHITFVVRNDASTSDLFFQTSDATWQAYNVYGDNNNGKSLYTGAGGKAVKVSYNRPFLTRDGGGGGGPQEDWLFNAEYPMVRWLESNGYDVTYTTNVDSDRRGNLIKNHKVFLSVGHDEYWSGTHRAHVTAARDAGTHLAFFSGNEVYWKTRWENSIDGSGTSHRTLVCYKEGGSGENTCSGKCDPSPEWTGLWRSGCEYRTGNPLVDGCNPENELTGQISWKENTVALQVPSTYSRLRFWRNTSVASLGSGQTASMTFGTIGYEWNAEQEQFRSTYPSGRIILSRTVIDGNNHHLSLYRHSSGALVFGAGTVQYSWGLDSNHDRGSAAPSVALQQATVNLFADMGVQPGSIRAGLVAATASTDAQAPVTTISSPAEDASVPFGTSVTVTGTATDNSIVAGVEVSTDGGNTWRLANGTTNWSYTWTPAVQGTATIRSRAFDDSGNMGLPTVRNVTVGGTVTVNCPCTVFQPSSAPTGTLQSDGQALQLGMKFRSSVNGFVTGVKFYKQSGNTGTHTGQLYSGSGALLASVVFQNETASGWQQAAFSSPVAVTAGTTYVITYHSSAGTYSANDDGFSQAILNGPLAGLQNGTDGPNGIYRYTSSPAFPTNSFSSSNYWVDVVFNTSTSPGNQIPTAALTSPANNATFTAPATINLSASAADADGTISKVEFFQGTTKLGEDLTSPYTFSWNNVSAGTYQLTAKATDNGGAVTTSAAVNVTVSGTANVPPTVALTSPANNATFTAPASISLSATASDADGSVARVEFYNGTAKLGEDLTSPYAFSWANVPAGTYQLTARAFDNLGLSASSAVASVTVGGAPSGCPCTVFQPSSAPTGTLQSDGQALQLGMKFQASVNGLVTGVKFYKQSGNTGTHTGQLYSGTGTLLASVVFQNETATGWQEAAFTSPVAVTGGTTYVITYHSSAGNYSADDGGFSQAVVNGPLRGLANGESGLNGVYRYTSAPAFPSSGYQASNYWVDVVFNTGTTTANQPPAVSLTAPANNATFTAPASISLSATASDSDGSVTKVEFYNGDAKLGEDLTSPYTFNWSNVAAGTYQLTARATDNSGVVTTSAAVSVTVNPPANQAPAVAISSPANNATFTAPASISISANASDADGTVSKVEFYNGSTKLGEDLSSPYSYNWSNVAAGSYQLSAKAIDNNAAVTTSAAVTVTVTGAVNTPPTVTIISPANNAAFTAPATIAINVNASDTESGVALVEFYNGTTKLGEDATSPYTYTWNSVAAGSYALTARATDNAGASATSAVINVSVNAPANQPPVVSLTSPANNATFTAPASINLGATASDTDGSVARVEFYNGTAKLGEDLTSPYAFSWANVPAGTYQLTARAFDNLGLSASSAAATVTVGVATSGCPCTVFQPSAAPNGALQNDRRAIQLGMKFRSSVNGFVTGVRFYKQSGNTGTHTGQLYSGSGALLASVVFQNETASGWQEAAFSSPVAVTAGTTYVITYHSSAGHYSANDNGFSQAIVNGPLRGLANGESGRNGVYRYTNTPAYPTSNYQASNYWVDVVFNTAVASSSQVQTAVIVNEVVEESAHPSLLIFPNPSLGEGIQVEVQGLESMEGFSITLYNSTGSEVAGFIMQADEDGNFKEEIKFSPELPKGAYTVRMQSEKHALGQTLIISK